MDTLLPNIFNQYSVDENRRREKGQATTGYFSVDRPMRRVLEALRAENS